MASREDIALMSHLMRRAGFGSSRDEIEILCDQGYEATVEELLDPDSKPPVDEYALYRHHPSVEVTWCRPNWLYFMTTTQRPLQEKIALFWHHIFATSFVKLEAKVHLLQQIALFREHGMGSYRDLLISVAKDPGMIFWLDNNENHRRAPNENWGRELLELFSLGVGNYTEEDVAECTRAFTGWTIDARLPTVPYGPFRWKFAFRAEDHDYTEKAFLGQTGNFDGEDIIDIILQQPACPRFISRHLYNFFVADEPQVPAWNVQEPRDPEAVQLLSETLVENDFEIKPVLRTLFNSDFFKEATYQKVKSPVEVVVSTLRSTGDLTGPDPRLEALSNYPGYMGQNIMDPPSVEGWHTGVEWINSGSLVNRVNFVADRVSNADLPGVRRMVERVATNGASMTATELVDRCLDILGPLTVSDSTRDELLAHVESDGAITPGDDIERRTAETFALIVATREYQLA
ncbi:DUF1800 domain-containing protein [Dehalococcoidia bacterium]|nr:DUF1800 domain-containing protein [Dehalococcoidia bacterium]